MEAEAPKLSNGAAQGDSSPAPVATDDGIATFSSMGAADEDAKALRQEVQDLQRDRAGMQRRLEELVAEVERSEVEKKALAAHASYLEGALSATQHDLAMAAESDAELQSLTVTLRGLELTKIPELEARIAVLENQEVHLVSQRDEATAALAEKEGEILSLRRQLDALKLNEKVLEEKLAASEVKAKEAVQVEAEKRVAREEELERALKELTEKNSELEMKITLANQSKINREILPINGKKEDTSEVGMAEVESGGKVSWAAAASMAAATSTVAVVATTFYLRHAKQS